MADYINSFAALIDAIKWPVFIVALIWYFRKHLKSIVAAIVSRIKHGAAFSAGPISIGELKYQVEEQSRRIDQITVSTESTLQSLASLVIADPLKLPSYKKHVEERIAVDQTIIVGGQDFTEQRLLCAIITKLLAKEAAKGNDLGFKHIIPKYDFGGAGLNFIAISRGDIDIYPAYTWQGFEMAYATGLPQNAPSLMALSPAEAVAELKNLYADLSRPLTWLGCTGYRNNWEIVVTRKFAEANGIEKVSDLRRLNNNVRLGCEHDFFARPNGYGVLKNSAPVGYGIAFGDVKLLHHAEAYAALDKDQVDVIDGFTTDPQLQNGDTYLCLPDDESRFGYYYGSIVVRSGLLSAVPAIAPILARLENAISCGEISRMVQEADAVSPVEHKEGHIAVVERLAEKFLDEKGLLDPQASPVDTKPLNQPVIS